jgi:hypothetical protein
MVKGEYAYFDQLGSTAAAAKGSQHEDTVIVDTPHSRRRVPLTGYAWAELIDSIDKVKMLADPTNPYLEAGVRAMNRAIDDVIIAAAGGTASTGVAGGTSTVLPNSQKIASYSAGAGSKLNLTALRSAKQKFMAAEVDPSNPLYLVADANQIMALLGDSTVTSADFNTVKALVQGDLDTFMGFKFIRSERLLARSGALSFSTTDGSVGAGTGDADTYKRCFAFAGDGILLALGEDIKTRIAERAGQEPLHPSLRGNGHRRDPHGRGKSGRDPLQADLINPPLTGMQRGWVAVFSLPDLALF